MDAVSKKVIVTGGAGFLGSHLCEQLLNRGMSVVCVDNLATGSLVHIDSFFACPTFQFIKHDVITPLTLDGIDQIYNLACPASPKQYQKNPIQTLKTSVYGAANMLELCHQHQATILQTSTSEVYGDPEIHPQHERYVGHVNPLGIRACYEEGKRAAETLFVDYHRQYGTRIKIARLFNVYGPRMQLNDGRVIPNFILQALQNQPITINGDGLQTRSFCYVTDTLSGLQKLMQSGDDCTGPINIGNPHEITMIELAETIIDLIGSTSQLTFLPTPQDDPKRRRPDIQLANKQLDWAPTIPLKEGLTHTIAYFDTMLQREQVA